MHPWGPGWQVFVTFPWLLTPPSLTLRRRMQCWENIRARRYLLSKSVSFRESDKRSEPTACLYELTDHQAKNLTKVGWTYSTAMHHRWLSRYPEPFVLFIPSLLRVYSEKLANYWATVALGLLQTWCMICAKGPLGPPPITQTDKTRHCRWTRMLCRLLTWMKRNWTANLSVFSNKSSG